jgi:DNA ligase-1
MHVAALYHELTLVVVVESPMLFDTLAAYFERIESTSERLALYKMIAELLDQASAPELGKIAYLCEARLAPAFAGIEMGMGERLVAEAVAIATNRTSRQINRRYKQLGDLGLVAENLSPQQIGRLTVSRAHASLLKIATTSGPGSIDRKIRLLAALLRQASPRGVRYLVRLVVGSLRLGVGTTTIIEAVARSYPDHKHTRALIERAFNLCSDLGLVLKTARQEGLKRLSRFKLRVGRPVRMMMAERLPTAEAIIARLGGCAAEAKLDGFRCQVHLGNRKVEIFSRNLERTTQMFPDLVSAALKQIKGSSAIVEGEAVAINEATGEFYPFQVTVKRKRKHKIAEMAREFPLALIAFDLLYAHGKDYSQEPYQARHAELKRLIKAGGRIRLVERVVTNSAKELQHFFEEQVERGLEGIIAKRLDAPYAAGARNFNWIKLKRTYRGELSDTVDVVLVGYLRGRGMRASLKIGAVLGAVYDPRKDSFQTIAKIGSGLSEENWIKLRRLLDEDKVAHRPARVESRLIPDIWLEPRYVVTVLADEITRSPVHTCAQDKEGIGLALRFPRLVGFVRDDKSPEDATTVKEIAEMYKIQSTWTKR